MDTSWISSSSSSSSPHPCFLKNMQTVPPLRSSSSSSSSSPHPCFLITCRPLLLWGVPALLLKSQDVRHIPGSWTRLGLVWPSRPLKDDEGLVWNRAKEMWRWRSLHHKHQLSKCLQVSPTNKSFNNNQMWPWWCREIYFLSRAVRELLSRWD